jgi:hypothetical protein
MLDCHVEFLARVNIVSAQKTTDQILKDIESLKELPERFPFYDNPFIPEKRYRKLTSSKRYLIIYEVGEDVVYVDYILDCRSSNIIYGIAD